MQAQNAAMAALNLGAQGRDLQQPRGPRQNTGQAPAQQQGRPQSARAPKHARDGPRQDDNRPHQAQKQFENGSPTSGARPAQHRQQQQQQRPQSAASGQQARRTPSHAPSDHAHGHEAPHAHVSPKLATALKHQTEIRFQDLPISPLTKKWVGSQC